jgi:hypothetical protein
MSNSKEADEVDFTAIEAGEEDMIDPGTHARSPETSRYRGILFQIVNLGS